MMLDIIKILFIGTTWGNSFVYRLEPGENSRVIVKKKKISSETNGENSANSQTLIGIENNCSRDGILYIKEIINNLNWQEAAGVFICTNKMPDAKKIMIEIPKKNHSQTELYALDPDYFQTLIPLKAGNRRSIENYLLDLKFDQSMKARFKLFLKRIFVALNLSDKLYEQFIIVISPPA